MSKGSDFNYGGHDLESMLNARKYYEWITGMFAGHVGRNVIEVGAGAGSFSEHIMKHNVGQLHSIEPSSDMYPHLKKTAAKLSKENKKVKVVTHQGTLKSVKHKLKNVDTAVYVNVMEHIEDDAQELEDIFATLEKGGKLLIFVPALQGLLGSFDKQVGHFRRYSKPELIQKCIDAGFVVEKAHYADFLGIAPWWLSFKVLKRKKLNPHVVSIYDNFAVPVISRAEAIIKPPLGKNLLLVAVKP